jgi:hypothetical protein
MEELKLTQEKHKNVALSYENVVENIKSLCRLDNKRDETNINNNSIANYLNLNESKIDPVSNQSHAYFQISEEELFKAYSEFLENTTRTFEHNFLNKTEDEFVQMMRDKGYISQEPAKPGERSTKRKNSSEIDRDQPSKLRDLISNYNQDDYYSLRDDDLKREDDAFKIERDQMIKEFKEAV